MADAMTGAPTDRLSQRYLGRLEKLKAVRNLREKGELGADEQVLAGVPMFKRSPGISLVVLIGILPGLLTVLLAQRICTLIVTNRRVLMTGWSMSGSKAEQVLTLNRPVHLALSETPKKSHYFGNKVRLPAEIVTFLGRDVAYAQLGILAEYAFRVARDPGTSMQPAPPAPAVPPGV
jgi:hypothetical protein